MGLGQTHPLLDFGKNSAKAISENNGLVEELVDFIELLPEEFFNILIQYITEDVKVQEAILFIFTNEFHDLLRALEALSEYQALVVYLEKAGLPVIQSIQGLHRIIGMEDYVPPKIDIFKSLIRTEKIGDGMEGMLRDLYNVLPLDKIDALHDEKIKTSKTFGDFITAVTSEKMLKIVYALGVHETYKEFATKTNERGLDFEAIERLISRIIGIKSI